MDFNSLNKDIITVIVTYTFWPQIIAMYLLAQAQ